MVNAVTYWYRHGRPLPRGVADNEGEVVQITHSHGTMVGDMEALVVRSVMITQIQRSRPEWGSY